MAESNEIGKIKYTVEADISELKSDLSDAKTEVRAFGEDADRSTKKVSGGFKEAGESIERSTEEVRKFVGALSSVAGVVTGLTGAIGLLAGAFIGIGRSMLSRAREAQTLNKEFLTLEAQIRAFDTTSALSNLSDLTLQYSLMTDAIQDSNHSIEKQAELQEQLDQSYKNSIAEERKREFIEQRKELNKIDKSIKEIGQSTRDAMVTDPIEKETLAFEKQHRAIDQAVKKRRKLQSSLFGSKFQINGASAFEKSARRAIDKQHKQNLANIQKEVAERTRLENERIEKQAKREAEALAKALNTALTGVADSFFGSFGNTFTTRLDAITEELQHISRVNGRR